MADAKLTGLAQIKARFARLPAELQPALKAQLQIEVDKLVIAQKQAARAQGLEREAASIHCYPTPNREISLTIIADVADDKGKPIGSNIEQGHKAPDGSRVPGLPAFFPMYRALETRMRANMRKAGRAAIKKSWNDHG